MRLLPIALLIGLVLLLTMPALAQDDIPAPQFLYRGENQLLLVDGFADEIYELPIEVSERDGFEWSPDGRFLLASLYEDEILTYCLNLFDVDAQTWLYEEPIACNAFNPMFTADSEQFIYITEDGHNEVLWSHSLADRTNSELYRTTDGHDIYETGISELDWSPTKKYLTFIDFRWIMGGTLNTLVIMDAKSRNFIIVSAPNAYYASYNPIWSADERWFLIMLKEEYITSATLPRTNHEGDVYLVNAQSGETYRLTYTPTVSEHRIRWTEEGNIAFSVTTVQDSTFTLEAAMNVEVVPDEDIIWPESIYSEDFFDPKPNIMISPDENIGAWVTYRQDQPDLLNFGYTDPDAPASFSITMPESYQLVGWRPFG